jgi:polyhydroxybutyrate depolymerase
MTTARAVRVGLMAAVLALCASLASAEVMTWTVDGDKREAIVFAPAAPAGSVPLIFSFHGHGDDMENFQYVGLQQAWPDAIVVYFQGLPSRDGFRGWQVEPGEYHDRDLKLVDAALASLRKKYNVDTNRIYATGFSNGAHFTYLLWAARPQVFAAFAPVAGRMRASAMPTERRPVFHVAGEQDRQVPFNDQRQAIAVATRINGVTGPTTSCGSGCTVYGSGTGAPVMTWIHQGGHEYPPGTSARIASFFHDHPRTAPADGPRPAR